MFLAYTIYLFLLVLLFTASAHNNKLLLRSYQSYETTQEIKVFWRWPLFLGFSVLVLIVGLRYNVGVDYMGYYNDYYGIGFAHHWEAKIARYEFGYEFILRTLLYLNLKVWVLFTFVAILIWYFFIQSFKIFPFLLKWGIFFAFTTGFFFASMNGMRQTIALVIFMYAIKYIETKSLKKFTLYILLASSFHTSILLVYPFYFFINKISFTNIGWLAVYALTYILGNQIDIRDIIVFGLALFPKYQHYTERFLEDFNNPASIGLGNIYFFVVGLIIILFSKDLLKKMPRMKIYYNLFFIGSILFNFFWKYDILGRITYLFIWFKIFCLAALAYYFGKSKLSWLMYLLIFTQIIMFIYKIYKGENLSSPFQFINLA
ncbi:MULTISPECIES: EpsG family protein [Flavobacteriaceae]|uniref:EpsG family protein n=1 Tax=Flavobacteriaceae TaxID=49546 RepID=UPI0039196544